MHLIPLSTFALCIAGCLAVSNAHAAPVNSGQGGGYHGGVKYTNATMATVGPYPTWAQCNQALLNEIAHSTAPPPTGFGWQVDQQFGCHYRSGWTVDTGFNDPWQHFDFVVPIKADSPQASAELASAVSEEIARLRREFRVDEYDAALQAVADAAAGR
jgi:hypothetical protein